MDENDRRRRPYLFELMMSSFSKIFKGGHYFSELGQKF
jgi:hypothetical protein